jgi:heme O synthase-like polyprenyltransferase
VKLLRAPSPKLAMRLFTWSITYLTLLFVAMAAAQYLRV